MATRGGLRDPRGRADPKAGAFRSRVSAGISENAVELEYKGESGGLPSIYIYIYIYIHIYTHTHTHIHTYIYIYACVCIYI